MLTWQVHYYNTTGAPQPDSTAVTVCTQPSSAVATVGALTLLGTESLDIPAGMSRTHSSTCVNDSSGPIHVFGLWPHMRFLGTRMQATVQRSGGTQEVILDQPYDFNAPRYYESAAALNPGDTLTTSCTFVNTTGGHVSFGQALTRERCYLFAFSYPPRALDNGVLNLLGVENACW